MNLLAKHLVSHHSLSSRLLPLNERRSENQTSVGSAVEMRGLIFLLPLCHPSPRDLDCLGVKNRALVTLPVEEVLQTLNDLITYFQLPDAELEHEERQIKLRSLKNRQNLFKQEVSLTVQEIVITNKPVYKISVITSKHSAARYYNTEAIFVSGFTQAVANF